MPAAPELKEQQVNLSNNTGSSSSIDDSTFGSMAPTMPSEAGITEVSHNREAVFHTTEADGDLLVGQEQSSHLINLDGVDTLFTEDVLYENLLLELPGFPPLPH
jgi:hypothetical protein